MKYKKVRKMGKNRPRKANKKRKKSRYNFTLEMKKKLAVFFLVVLAAFAYLGFRIVQIETKDGEKYKKKVLSQQEYDSKTLPYKRGDILDANGTKLAYSEKVYNVCIDAKAIRTSKEENALTETLNALAYYFQIDTAKVGAYIAENENSRYYVAKKQIPYDEMSPFLEAEQENKSITGVWFEQEYKRQYPCNKTGSTIIGFTGSDNNGTYGLEEYYNSILNGTNGREYGYLGDDSTLERTTISATDGKTLVTAIDVNIQSVVEKYINQFNEEHKGEYREGEEGFANCGVIVMNPKNGEILAMADNQGYDLNNPKDLSAFYTQDEISQMTNDEMYEALNKIWRNYCVSDTYEPGSVAKAMTIAAGLDSGKLSGNETYFCGGLLEVSGHKIKCHKHAGHGIVTVSQALEQSCNVALMQIAQQMGKETLMKYLYNFNIGLKTNVDISGEARTNTLVYNVDDMVASDLAISSFGQGYNVTMIQMASAFSSIINGGYYYQPHVVTEIRNADGTLAEKVEPRVLKQTVSATTSDRMKQYLANVCTLGTGKTAVPAGYIIGGKTGTAERQPRGNGQYVVSFMGFAPVDDPQVVIYCVIDRPNVADQPHSTFAQEIVKNIFTEILPYMNIFRTEEISDEEKEELQKLNVLPIESDAQEGTVEGEEDSNPEGEEGDLQENKPLQIPTITGRYRVDTQTGSIIDSETGETFDPSSYQTSPDSDTNSDTGEEADSEGSDLDGIIGMPDSQESEPDPTEKKNEGQSPVVGVGQTQQGTDSNQSSKPSYGAGAGL